MTFGYIRQSGGYLTIDSAPGTGTEIALYMPRTEEPA
jgi:signal transduction histidine kinase